MILALRTDKPEAEIYLLQGEKIVARHAWTAHRQLAETLHREINALLKKMTLDWPDITGVVVYEGPGSFTGLRIGLSVANALHYSLNVPVAGATGDNWQQDAAQLLKRKYSGPVIPIYGNEANITRPRK